MYLPEPTGKLNVEVPAGTVATYRRFSPGMSSLSPVAWIETAVAA